MILPGPACRQAGSSVSGFLYILKFVRNGKFYIGSTGDLKRRIYEHKTGRGCQTTKCNGEFELVFSKDFRNIVIAKKYESKLKKMKSKNVIEKIVKNQMISIKV